MVSSGPRPLLQMRGIRKAYPGVQALRGVDLQVAAGEVVALLGENGAGKSTLIKILGGAQSPDAGQILIGGQAVRIASPLDAIRAGIGIIYQEFNLIPGLTAWENIFLGREQTCWGFIRRGEERRLATQLFQRIGAAIPLQVPIRQLSVAQQQIVEIAKALSQQVRLLVMDEPTAALTPKEVELLLQVVRELRQQGIGIIYISHRLEEIDRIADRVTVLRDGVEVGNRRVSEVDRRQLIELMVGREMEQEFPKERAPIGKARLVVEDLAKAPRVRGVSLEVRRGEVLGITGLVGAGRTDLVRLLFGADRPDRGRIDLDGRRLQIRSPRDAIRAGLCLLTEDRQGQGLMLDLSVRENFALPNLPRLSRFGFVRWWQERQSLASYIESLRIKLPGPEQPVKFLSGGNQQKVVLAKWLESQAEVVIFDEPTRGIDVGAKFEIYQLINRLAAAGKSIIMVSSELPEILGMSDRILVMSDGRIRGEITDVANTTQQQIMQLSVG